MAALSEKLYQTDFEDNKILNMKAKSYDNNVVSTHFKLSAMFSPFGDITGRN